MAVAAPLPPPQRPPLRVLVLGGSGFIGRHAVNALLDRGCRVIIGSRHPQRIERKLPDDARDCPRRAVRLERLTEADDWATLLADVDVGQQGRPVVGLGQALEPDRSARAVPGVVGQLAFDPLRVPAADDDPAATVEQGVDRMAADEARAAEHQDPERRALRRG